MKYKSLSLLIIALLSACTLGAQNRKKVGVVLSGGGAKGVAHIGALKVIEEAGIPIDYVVGTSMGALVGGLYSIGYTPQQLDSIVNAQNWKFLLSDTPRSGNYIAERKAKGRTVLALCSDCRKISACIRCRDYKRKKHITVAFRIDSGLS